MVVHLCVNLYEKWISFCLYGQHLKTNRPNLCHYYPNIQLKEKHLKTTLSHVQSWNDTHYDLDPHSLTNRNCSSTISRLPVVTAPLTTTNQVQRCKVAWNQPFGWSMNKPIRPPLWQLHVLTMIARCTRTTRQKMKIARAVHVIVSGSSLWAELTLRALTLTPQGRRWWPMMQEPISGKHCLHCRVTLTIMA